MGTSAAQLQFGFVGIIARIIIRGPHVLNRRMPRQQVPVPGVEISNTCTPGKCMVLTSTSTSARNRSMCRRAASQHSRLIKANRHRRMPRASHTVAVALPSGSGRGVGRRHSTACAHNDSSGDVRRHGGCWRGGRGVRRRPVVQWPLRRWSASARTMGRSQQHRRPQEHWRWGAAGAHQHQKTSRTHVNFSTLTLHVSNKSQTPTPVLKYQSPYKGGRASRSHKIVQSLT